MKSLVFSGEFDKNKDSRFWLSGFIKAGFSVNAVEVRKIDFGDEFLSLVRDSKPDLIFHNVRYVPIKILKEARKISPDSKVILFLGDIQSESFEMSVLLSEVSDAIMLSNSDSETHDYFRKGGYENVWELQCATDVRVYKEIEGIETTHELSFVGNNQGRTRDYIFRRDTINKLLDDSRSNRIIVAGGGWARGIEGVSKSSYSRFTSRASFQLVINGFGFLNGCFSNRTWNALACSRLVLHYRTKGMEKYAVDGKHLVVFDNYSDLLNKVFYYKEHMDEARQIANEGRLLVRRKHTYHNRAQEIMCRLDELNE